MLICCWLRTGFPLQVALPEAARGGYENRILDFVRAASALGRGRDHRVIWTELKAFLRNHFEEEALIAAFTRETARLQVTPAMGSLAILFRLACGCMSSRDSLSLRRLCVDFSAHALGITGGGQEASSLCQHRPRG